MVYRESLYLRGTSMVWRSTKYDNILTSKMKRCGCDFFFFFVFEKSVSLNVIMFLNINIHALAKTFITETRSKKWLTCFTSTATSSPVIFIGWETLREMKMKGVTIILPHNNTVKSLHLHFYCLRLITVQATTSIDSFSLPQQISLIITSRKRNGEMWVRLCVIRGQINNQ